jgi:hypothetical protein
MPASQMKMMAGQQQQNKRRLLPGGKLSHNQTSLESDTGGEGVPEEGMYDKFSPKVTLMRD